MVRISDVAECSGGTPQFRISVETSADAPVYLIYSQMDLEDDLKGLSNPDKARRQIRTFDSVCTASTGDIVFSLLTGTAAIVQSEREGYLLTQNYVLITPGKSIDSRYLVYLLNENRMIKRQLQRGQQGSSTMKYTLRQLCSLELPTLPSEERQQLIAELYFHQLRLEPIPKRGTELQTKHAKGIIGKAEQSWTS